MTRTGPFLNVAGPDRRRTRKCAWGANMRRCGCWPSCVVALAIGTPVQTQDPAGQAESLAPALAAARALVDGGRPAEAIERLTALDQADPRVQLLTGVALYHADRRREAIEVLERVRARLPEGSIERREAEQVLGLSLYLESRFADAIPWLERTRAAAPDNLELHFTLGQAYIQTRDAAAARAALAKTFGVAADSTAANVVTAQLMIRLQMESLAEAELTAALDARPAHAARQLPARADCALPRPARRGGGAVDARAGDQPVRCDGVLSARRRAAAPESRRRGDRRAAAVAVAEPVLQRARTSCSAAPT